MGKISAAFLALEPLILLVITAAFWFPSPIRDRWLWLLGLLLPVYGARRVLHRRLWTWTPLDGWLLAFLVLGIVNITAAPYTRGIIMLGRPLLGMALYFYCVEYARTRGHLRGLMGATLLLVILTGALAMISTQWIAKSDQLSFITDVLPTIDLLPQAGTTFNPNEIAGALAWLCPLSAGLALYRWTRRWLSLGFSAAFALLFTALFLGQSRFALAGVLAALAGVALLIVPSGRWRRAALAGLGAVVLVEAGLVFNVFPSSDLQNRNVPGAALSERDESSFSKRFGIWNSALNIVKDYPLTGVGMAMFRDSRVRQAYPAPGFEDRILPHAHNEWLQVAADLGVPGLLVYIMWHGVIGWMLVVIWQRGDTNSRVVAAALGAGLLAHTAFGIGDAITLWDRLAFVFWWLVGLVGAQYNLVMGRKSSHAYIV